MQISVRVLPLLFPILLAAQTAPGLRNSDANYQSLRTAALGDGFVVEEVTLTRDVAEFRLRQGVMTFAAPVMGKVTMAVFTGMGELKLKPVSPIEKQYVKGMVGVEEVNEAFTQAVFIFTDSTHEELMKSLKAKSADAGAASALKEHRERVRRRPETTLSFTESILTSESMDNLEADVLAHLYNPSRPQMFNAFMKGPKRKDLRFFMRGTGAVPDLMSPEEVALLNVEDSDGPDGIWYHGHYKEKILKSGYNVEEVSAVVRPVSYEIEAVLEGTKRLNCKVKVELRSELDGERVIKFGLLPDLRVSSVTDAAGTEMAFVQEDKKQDGSFYVILPKGLKSGERAVLNITYEGEKVLTDAGGGSTYVGARTSWYPSVNSFTDRVPYVMRFKAPKKFSVVASGKKVKTWAEGNLTCTEWRSDAPHAVAGFNVGIYKEKQLKDERTGTEVEGYATRDAPDYLRDPNGPTIAPSALLDSAMGQTQGSLQLFTHWFGPLPYKHISVTQQPDFSFGQSWPELVYLPLSAFLDSTTRYRVLGRIDMSLTDFVDEVTPHEVAHQWWGHLVGWGSYRDQWLSEGLATFSASLYLEAVEKDPKKFIRYWEKARTSMMEKNRYGVRGVDAGPIFLGLRASTRRTPGGHRHLTYLKGGYVWHMLRMMMQDSKTGDEKFIAMMRDLVESHKQQNATLASVSEVVDRHIQGHMNLAGNDSMAWYFRQWVLGTEIPKYEIKYEVTPAEKGHKLKATISQSEVTEQFAMPVPIYIQHEGRIIRLGRMTLIGNQTKPIEVVIPVKPEKVMLNAFADILER